MANIKFPPKCEPIHRNAEERFLEDHLTSIFYYFVSFAGDKEDVTEYDNLWRELNEIGKMENAPVASVLACCCGTEILRNWLDAYSCVEKSYADCYFDLYKNVARHLKKMSPTSTSRTFVWECHLLQLWAEKKLFRLTLVDKRMNETVVEQLFTDMVQSLLHLGTRKENLNKYGEYVKMGLRQMVETSSKIGKSALKEILMPFFAGNSSTRLLLKGCISHLNARQCQFICSLISRRILLNHRYELLNGTELHIAEKLLLDMDNIDPFEPLILVTTKAALNCFHREHERILRILCVLLLRFTESCKNTLWEDVELDRRKKIQLMASRFKSGMVNSYSKYYPSILINYGSLLLRFAPNAEIKFRYLQIFQYYIKNCRGDCRDQLMKIFDQNIN